MSCLLLPPLVALPITSGDGLGLRAALHFRSNWVPNRQAFETAPPGHLWDPKIMMPSPLRYQRFLEALRKNVRTFDNAKTDELRLAVALAALQGVIIYLQGDEEIAEQQLARPLGWLESAVNDSARGANPAALKAARPVSGRPTGLAREEAQGAVAFGVELLVMAAKVPPEEASKFVARKSRKLVASENGDEITANQIAGWRRELNRGGATTGGRDIFRRLRQHYRTLFEAPSASQRERCEALALGTIRGVSVAAPRSAPNRRARRG